MNNCPVCGYQMAYPANDFHICPSCGTEFGYDDSGTTYEDLRAQWLKTGPLWWSPVDPRPTGWNPFKQMMGGIFLNANPAAAFVVNANKNLATWHYAPIPKLSFVRRKRPKSTTFSTPVEGVSPFGQPMRSGA